MTRVLYIAGYGRSGSTVLERILAAHPDAVGVGEIRNLPDLEDLHGRTCSCGAAVPVCPVWGPALTALAAWRTPDALSHQRTSLAAFEGITPATPWAWLPESTFQRGERLQYLRYLRSLYAALAQASGRSLVVESSKTDRRGVHRVQLLREAGLDVTVVHLVRDPHGCAWSVRKGRNTDLEAGVVRTRRSDVLRMATSWCLANAAAERAAAGGPAVRVRYEDLMAQPDTTLAHIGLAAGLDLSGVAASLAAGTIPPAHQIGGNRMRTSLTLRLRPDEDWRTHLAPFDRRLVSVITAPWARRYGY